MADFEAKHIPGSVRIEGQNFDAIEFVDAYFDPQMTVVDSGIIILPSREFEQFEKTALADGYSIAVTQ